MRGMGMMGGKPPSLPKPPSTPRMKMVKPSYSARSPIVNDTHFTDGPKLPTIGSPQASFNPGQSASPMPSGPPRFLQTPGKRVYAKGLTNKRITQNI